MGTVIAGCGLIRRAAQRCQTFAAILKRRSLEASGSSLRRPVQGRWTIAAALAERVSDIVKR
jgi:hypothetical protein